ncbi:MAG: DUF362 domain-containing protein [Chloroflexi bacterium]|nr:DUF362 domain-containing protein [Chloroflexota bacterium]
MVYPADSFVFQPPAKVAFARRVLIKPDASQALPYPISTSREILETIITGLRRVSDADIILLDTGQGQEPVQQVFRVLGYDFPRVLALDVRDCVYVEVENPLPKPWALPTVWVPNVLLSCDYLISVASFKVAAGRAQFTLGNLMGLLPPSKYPDYFTFAGKTLEQLGLDNIIADLYFTLPFDLGVIDARKRLFLGPEDRSEVEDYGKIFSGEPFTVDREASEAAGVGAEYLRLIALSKATFAA